MNDDNRPLGRLDLERLISRADAFLASVIAIWVISFLVFLIWALVPRLLP